ncbi:bromodomain-containing protein 8 [Toxorhynchites rutilus septentrionalis]|uniref:bromodomain-containing protein 8 n=1 Tax=Toxorhynchites rutilus septentrionalis TaxID=329112 RepID=UPI002479DA26|nr:bromodomain-containing protein 8 [Toxorhynchites rutilus septentrionalis]XP_055644763.1 bromodomain-containing protein 8 [Toxorhynchites rutilus septentrionalis]
MNNLPSIQERLQLKRVPLDKWSTKEKLCLASAVACSGDQNWMSVSRALKVLCGTNRPGDWFSQKSCAAQYGKLLENVETPKRKKRTASERDGVIAVETPSESILRKLTQERIIELKKLIQEEAQQYTKVKEDIILIQSGVTDEKKLREMWKQIEMEKAQKEREQVLHAQWLKEREEKKLELERQWRPMFPNSPNAVKIQATPVKVKDEIDEDSQSSSKSGTSPLLTSLLKNPSANTTGNALMQTSSGKAASSPTITNLLTGNSSAAVNVQANKIFPTIVASQSFDGNQSASSAQGAIKTNTGNMASFQIAPNQSASIDAEQQEHNASVSERKSTPSTPSAEDQNLDKAEDIETDSDNVDPAKDLMAVFQELMPEELDEILNDNNAMILEDEILENVVDSIMEEAEALKEKNEGVLDEPIASSATNTTESKELPVTGSKNEETIPEVIQTANSDATATDISPAQTVSEELSILGEQEVEKSVEEAPEKANDTQEEKSKQSDELSENVSEVHSETNEDEIVPAKDSRSNSPLTNISSVENKETADVQMEDSIDQVFESCKEEGVELPNPIQADAEEDSEDKPLASLDTSSNELKMSESKPDVNNEIKEENFDSTASANISSTSAQDSKESKERQTSTDEEEAARAKKEALEKLASEYDFKDDDEPIVPLSIQKSKEEKPISEEDIFMDAQETLDDPEENMQDMQKLKKCEEPVVTVTDTDDDSLIEMKISKTKRDYSRRRPADDSLKVKEDQLATPKNEESSEGRTLRKLRDRDRSESPFILLDEDANDKMKRSYSSTPVMDSIPNSPASSEDKDYRAWKKSILSIHSKITSLRYASSFLKPLPDDQTADLIFRPMDLSTIKRNIDNGNIRTTAEYQRDLMLVCTNAIMLNRADLCSPTAARVLLKESTAIIETNAEVNKNARDKESETRSGSASKRNSRKGNTRSSTSAARI